MQVVSCRSRMINWKMLHESQISITIILVRIVLGAMQTGRKFGDDLIVSLLSLWSLVSWCEAVNWDCSVDSSNCNSIIGF